MERSRKSPALLLALVMLISLTLTGCGKKAPPIPGDQFAEAAFDMSYKRDAAKMVELFGYANEEEAFSDWGSGSQDGLGSDVADKLLSQFSSEGFTATKEELQTYLDGIMELCKKVEFDASVKECDENAGTAVVTCTVNTFDSGSLEEIMAGAAFQAVIENGLDLYTLTDDMIADIAGQILCIAVANFSELEPTDKTVDFDIDFVLSDFDSKTKGTVSVWMPKEASDFGSQIVYHILGS